MFASVRFMASIAVIACAASGCGTTTPDIHEFWGTAQDAAEMEAVIVRRVSCELRAALRDVIEVDALSSRLHGKSQLNYLKGWNAQLQFTLIVDEKSSINPTATFTEPLANAITHFSRGRSVTSPQSFVIGGSFTYSNEAIRTDKLFLTYRIDNLIKDQIFYNYCTDQDQNHSTLFVQSDLKIRDWLFGALNVRRAEYGDRVDPSAPVFSPQKDALSHDVKFEIVTSGNINPTWRLVQFGTDSTSFLSGSRDRTQELVITMGPPDKANPDQLGPTAQTSSLASQINSAITAALRRPNL